MGDVITFGAGAGVQRRAGRSVRTCSSRSSRVRTNDLDGSSERHAAGARVEVAEPGQTAIPRLSVATLLRASPGRGASHPGSAPESRIPRRRRFV